MARAILCLLVSMGALESVAIPQAFAMGRRPRLTPAIITGVIRDQATNQILRGASVRLATLSGQTLAVATPGRVGIYTISQPQTGACLLSASATGYTTQTVTHWLQPGRTSTVDFRLTPLRPNRPPHILSLTPKHRATVVVGDQLSITLKAVDPDRDPLQYRVSLDGQVIKDWSASPTTSLKTTIRHHGRHTIKAEVRDANGGSDATTVDVYVFRAFPKPGN